MFIATPSVAQQAELILQNQQDYDEETIAWAQDVQAMAEHQAGETELSYADNS